MKKEEYYTRGIGVMSGTSLDGLDLAYCIFKDEGSYEISEFRHISYPKKIEDLLRDSYTLAKESLGVKEEEYSNYRRLRFYRLPCV